MASLDSGSFIATGSATGSFAGLAAFIQRLLGTAPTQPTEPNIADPL